MMNERSQIRIPRALIRNFGNFIYPTFSVKVNPETEIPKLMKPYDKIQMYDLVRRQEHAYLESGLTSAMMYMVCTPSARI